MKAMKSFIGCLAILVLFISLLGCATINSNSSKLMPSEKNIDILQWKDYEEAEDAFKKIEWDKTTIAELKNLGFNPKGKGVTILDSLTIRDIIIGNNSSFKVEHLPPRLQEYLKDLDTCEGFKFEGKFSATKSKGNILLRWLKFRKVDVDSAWGYEAWIFVKRGLVVYTRWIGKKPPDKERTKKNPLGPFQELGDLVIGTGRSLVN